MKGARSAVIQVNQVVAYAMSAFIPTKQDMLKRKKEMFACDDINMVKN